MLQMKLDYNTTNLSSSVILVAQGLSAPISDYNTEQLTTLDYPYAKAQITGTDPLWAKAVGFDGYVVATEV